MMGKLKTYPEMNAEIVNILRLSPDDDTHRYAAQLIEEQAAQLTALQGEIAELRARLEKSVDLPCEIGDTVYKLCPANLNIGMGDLRDGKVVKNNCDRCAYKSCDCSDILSTPTTITIIDNVTVDWIFKRRKCFGKMYFLSLEEAESALAECERGTVK